MENTADAVRDAENTVNRMGDKAKDAACTVKSTAHDLYNSAGQAVNKLASQVSDKAEKGYNQLRSSGSEMVGQVEGAVKESPTNAVLIAAGFGLLAGLLLARK